MKAALTLTPMTRLSGGLWRGNAAEGLRARQEEGRDVQHSAEAKTPVW